MDRHQYNPDNLIVFKVPLYLPYQLDESSFQRIDGEVTIQGVQYKYVERRVLHDSLILLCVPNEAKMKLADAKNSYFRNVNDFQQTHSNHSKDHSIFKSLLSDYVNKGNCWTVQQLSTANILSYPLINQHSYSLIFIEGPTKPPRTYSFTV